MGQYASAGPAGTPERETVRTYHQALAVLFCLGATAIGLGDQYWVSYEADGTYPEDAGWTRYALGGGAQRWFEDGALVIDSLADPGITEVYAWSRPGNLDPARGQVFTAQWRLCISDIAGLWGPTVGVYSDQQKAVFLQFEWDGVHIGGVGTVATFEPGVFHDFELRSADMLTYDLYIDNVLAYSGSFWSSVTASLVSWGENSLGFGSVARWDSFRFGVVVPEPCGVWLASLASLAVLKARRRGAVAAPRC